MSKISRPERVLHGCVVPPFGVSRDFEKPLQRPARVGMFRSETRQNGLTEYPHFSMLPYMGTAVKALRLPEGELLLSSLLRRKSWKPRFLASQTFLSRTPCLPFIDSPARSTPRRYPKHSAIFR